MVEQQIVECMSQLGTHVVGLDEVVYIVAVALCKGQSGLDVDEDFLAL
jgi:hypothetical protein